MPQLFSAIPPDAEWHPNVIRFDRLIQTEERSLLVMPLYDQQMKVCLPMSHCKVYFEKLAGGILWLHDNFITHNDIKLANIVLNRSHESELGGPVVIGECHSRPALEVLRERELNTLNGGALHHPADFGFATSHLSKQGQDGCFNTSERWGTTEYLSPERALGEVHDERLSDVWALGM